MIKSRYRSKKKSNRVRESVSAIVLLAFTLAIFTVTPVIASTITYDYDDAGRLVKADYGNGTAIEYGYDGAGNLLLRQITGEGPSLFFDTGPGTYPSISGTHNGTITPNVTIEVAKLYTYPCPGTGGHTEIAMIWNKTVGECAVAEWNGYIGDYHNISFNKTLTLEEGVIYNYTIRTGSYPQIIHAKEFNATGGTITCDKFIDANGRICYDWIPAIRLWIG